MPKRQQQLKAPIKPDTTLEKLSVKGLVTRGTYHCLFNAGIHSVGTLIELVNRGKGVHEIYNIQSESVQEVKFILLISKLCGIYVRDDKDEDYFGMLKIPYQQAITRSFDKCIRLKGKLQDFLTKRYPDAGAFFNSVVKGKTVALSFQADLSMDGNIVYRHWHIDTLKEIQKELKTLIGNNKRYLLDALTFLVQDFQKNSLNFSTEEFKAYSPLEEVPLGNEANPAESKGKRGLKKKSVSAKTTVSPNNKGVEKDSPSNEVVESREIPNKEKVSWTVEPSATKKEKTSKAKDLSNKKHLTEEICLSSEGITISTEIEKVFQDKYEELSAKLLDRRALHFKETFIPNYKKLLEYLDLPLSEYGGLCPGHTMTKVLEQIYELAQKFKAEFAPLYQHLVKDARFLTYKIKRDLPFLTSTQRKFVESFINLYGIRPIFYLAYRTILTSSKKECVYFRLFYGLNDGQKQNLSEIASTEDYTVERIRQIIHNRKRILESLHITPQEIIRYQNLLTSNLITEDSPEFKNLVLEEHLPEDFNIFSVLCLLICDYKICKSESIRLLVVPGFKKLIKISYIKNELNRIYNQDFNEDTFFPFSHFIGSDVPSEYEKDIINLFNYLSKGKENISVREDGLLFKPSNLNISRELYNILLQEGRPLHLREIFDRFKNIHPEHKFWKPSQIMPYLHMHENIRAKGKQYLFGIDSWDNFYYGSIKSLLIKTLEEKGKPIHIKELFEIAKRYFPSTTRRSIYANMRKDTFKRFVRFKDGYFGLSSKEYPLSYEEIEHEGKVIGIPPLTFDQRIEIVRNFFETHHRFPFGNSPDKKEASLRHWIDRFLTEKLKLSPDKKARFNNILEEYAHMGYPRFVQEYNFRDKCSQCREYVEKYKKLPMLKDDQALYYWFKRNLKKFHGYKDQRHDYFMELCDYLRELGFEVDV